MNERVLRMADPTERANLAAFVARAVQLDPAAVIRLRIRPDGRVDAWVMTGFDALAVRACGVESAPADTTVAADRLRDELSTGSIDLDLGYSMDSAWRAMLPPAQGFLHVDDVPARELVELARQGVELANRQGAGPPTSLLDQEVVTVSGRGGAGVGIPMRVVFALRAMGFIPSADVDDHELVRVRATAMWLRLDARYGSIAKRRTGELSLLVR